MNVIKSLLIFVFLFSSLTSIVRAEFDPILLEKNLQQDMVRRNYTNLITLVDFYSEQSPAKAIALAYDYNTSAPDSHDYLAINTYLAKAFLEYGDSETAQKLITENISHPDITSLNAIYAKNLGLKALLKHFEGNNKQSVNLYKQALATLSDSDDNASKVSLLNDLAEIDIKRYNLSAALASLYPQFNQIDLTRDKTDFTLYQTRTLVTIANILNLLEEYELAYTLFSVAEDKLPNVKLQKLQVLTDLGKVTAQIKTGKFSQAAITLPNLVKDIQSLDAVPIQSEAYAQIAQLYLFQENLPEAQKWQKKAEALFKTQQNNIGQINNNITALEIKIHKEPSNAYIDEINQMLKDNHSVFSPLQRSRLHKLKAKIALKQGDNKLFKRFSTQAKKELIQSTSEVEQLQLDLHVHGIYNETLKNQLSTTNNLLERRDLRHQIILTALIGLLVLVFTLIHRNLKKNQRIKRLQVQLNLTNTESAYLSEVTKSDQLTGLLNRRYMEDALAKNVPGFLNKNKPVSMMLLNIDGFSQIVDQNGHQCGDEIVKTVASALQSACRNKDSIAHWGVAEYIIFMPETRLEGAKVIAEKMRQIVEKLSFSHQGVYHSLTLSIGITTALPEQPSPVGELIKQADLSLSKSEHNGGNQLSVFRPY